MWLLLSLVSLLSCYSELVSMFLLCISKSGAAECGLNFLYLETLIARQEYKLLEDLLTISPPSYICINKWVRKGKVTSQHKYLTEAWIALASTR